MSPLHSSSFLSTSGSSLPLFSRFSDQPVVNLTPAMTEKPYRAIDITVAVGIIGLLVALLIPTLNSRAIMLPTVTQGLVNHLRLARAGAASRGTHFRVTFRLHTYAIEQLQDSNGDGIWEPDSNIPAWHVSLPPTVAIGSAVDTAIEFDTRGLVSAASQDGTVTPVTVKLTDSQTEKSAVIEILPSGKVQRSFGGIA
jgi:Type II transport protein GspH